MKTKHHTQLLSSSLPHCPLLLCIETSGTICSIALAEIILPDFSLVEPSLLWLTRVPRTRILSEISFLEPYQHDRVLAKATEELLSLTQQSIRNITAVAVSAGPGSFTGLRIGAAFAKALAFDDDASAVIDKEEIKETTIETITSGHSTSSLQQTPLLIAVPTMTALSYAAREAAYILQKQYIQVVVPSHKNLVYSQEFEINKSDGNITPISEIILCAEDLLQPQNAMFYAGTYFTPDKNIDFTRLTAYCQTNARMIAEYAAILWAQGMVVSSAEFVPLYAQEFVPKK